MSNPCHSGLAAIAVDQFKVWLDAHDGLSGRFGQTISRTLPLPAQQAWLVGPFGVAIGKSIRAMVWLAGVVVWIGARRHADAGCQQGASQCCDCANEQNFTEIHHRLILMMKCWIRCFDALRKRGGARLREAFSYWGVEQSGYRGLPHT